MNLLLILFAKLLILIGKKLKRGSSLPGKIIYKINKNIFKYFKFKNTKLIGVTGSSGKGSSSYLIVQILRDLNYKVGYNDSGSNLSYAILTTIIDNCDIFGNSKVDYFVFEMDERFSIFVFKDLIFDQILITNITKDQPPRQYNPETVINILNKGLKNQNNLIINANDPIMQHFTFNKNVTYYDIKDKNISYQTQIFNNSYTNYHNEEKIKYHHYYFENTGDYYCEKNNFKTPKSDISATLIDYEKLEILVNGINFKLAYPMLFDVYNTLSVISLFYALNFNLKTISNSMKKRYIDKKIYNSFIENNRKVVVINNKNENSGSFNQAMLYLARQQEQKILVVGWKEISRRYEFNDMSWLYDVEFEIIKNVEKVYCVGIDAYDIALRMKYAGFKNIIISQDLKNAVQKLKNDNLNIYAVLNFDYILPFNKYMEENYEN